VAFTGAFHGMTLGALAASSNPTARNGAGTSLNEIVFMPYDGFLGPACNTMNYVEAMLSRAGSGIDRPAAAIIENVQGEGGLSSASAEWVLQLSKLCKDLGMLLIVDDIQAGCGRTGRFFSFEEFGIIPDIVVLSKSLSGFGTPLSVVLIRPELDIWRPGEHNGTFRGNNFAFVGATAAMENYWTNDDFPQAIKVRSDLVRRHLSKITMDLPAGAAKVNGRGLLIGLEFSDHGMAGTVSRRLFEDGIIVETCGAYGQVLKLLPALTITIKDLEFCLGAIANAVGDAHKETAGTPS
jgi:diaminobutyrate-2-oxoglutarate transaminase